MVLVSFTPALNVVPEFFVLYKELRLTCTLTVEPLPCCSELVAY